MRPRSLSGRAGGRGVEGARGSVRKAFENPRLPTHQDEAVALARRQSQPIGASASHTHTRPARAR